jgi:hypothetical protein
MSTNVHNNKCILLIYLEDQLSLKENNDLFFFNIGNILRILLSYIGLIF